MRWSILADACISTVKFDWRRSGCREKHLKELDFFLLLDWDCGPVCRSLGPIEKAAKVAETNTGKHFEVPLRKEGCKTTNHGEGKVGHVRNEKSDAKM